MIPPVGEVPPGLVDITREEAFQALGLIPFPPNWKPEDGGEVPIETRSRLIGLHVHASLCIAAGDWQTAQETTIQALAALGQLIQAGPGNGE